jgi:endonuclease I
MRTALTLALASAAAAQVPDGYYDNVDTSNAASLRATLHEAIDDHQKVPYSSSGTDTWNVLEFAQRNPSNTSEIIDVYRNDNYPKMGGGNNVYQREHTWPKSYGFPNDGGDNYPFSDCHQLWLCASSYNQARGNVPFRFCNSGCTEHVTVSNNGQGGGSGTYPGNSNWTSGSFASGTWEVWSGKRGDVARSILYMDIRYEGGVHGSSGFAEPDLRLTDSQSLIDGSNTGQNESIAYMGMLEALLAWHESDPVDDDERWRNDAVYAFQGNRNPFVDHPEWVDCIYNGQCSIGDEYCDPAVTNSSGLPSVISADGTVTIADDDFRLICSQMPFNQFGYFLASTNQGFVQQPGGSQGNLCLSGNIGRFISQVQNSSAFGSIGITLDLSSIPTSPPAAVMPGDTWNFQCWFRDKNPSQTSNFSSGLEVTFQ